MQSTKTIIRVRRGIKTRYCACGNAGNPIQGFNKLSDIRKHWQKEIKRGYIELVRELDKTPDMQAMNETKRMIETILRSYAKS